MDAAESADEEEKEEDEEEQSKKPEQPKQETNKPKSEGPFIIRARAMTFPLIVHELIKGVIMFFTSAGGTDNEKGQLAKKQATSLETEAYDLTYSEKFYEEFYNVFKDDWNLNVGSCSNFFPSFVHAKHPCKQYDFNESKYHQRNRSSPIIIFIKNTIIKE